MRNDYDDLKKHGFLKQKQSGSYIVRLRSIGGNLESEQLRRIADMADKYGQGYVHITTRQGVEIPWIKTADSKAAASEIDENGLKIGAHGATVRTVMACPGSEVCGFGLMNARLTGIEIDRVFFNRGVPISL